MSSTGLPRRAAMTRRAQLASPPKTGWFQPGMAMVVAALLLSAWGALLNLRETPVESGRPLSGLLVRQHESSPDPPLAAPRLVYPYSVVPGGVLNGAELEAAAAADPVVRAHYRGLNLRKARAETLARDRFAYVSYRIRDEVYWTSRKLKLAQGETVITDGVNMVRARCGNRISDEPRSEISLLEPPEITFDTPILPAPLRAYSTPPPPAEPAAGPAPEKEALPPAPAPLLPPPAPKPPFQPIIAGFLGGPIPAVPGAAAPPASAPPPAPPAGPPGTSQPPVAPPPTPSSPPVAPPASPPGHPPGVPPSPPPSHPPVTPPGTPPGTPPSTPPGTPPGAPPSSPPGQPPSTPSAPPPAGPPASPPSAPPATPPVEPPAPPPGILNPPAPEGPYPPLPPTPQGPPVVPPPKPGDPPVVPPPPITPIPEPSTYLLMGGGLAALAALHRRRSQPSANS